MLVLVMDIIHLGQAILEVAEQVTKAKEQIMVATEEQVLEVEEDQSETQEVVITVQLAEAVEFAVRKAEQVYQEIQEHQEAEAVTVTQGILDRLVARDQLPLFHHTLRQEETQAQEESQEIQEIQESVVLEVMEILEDIVLLVMVAVADKVWLIL